jgi:hypothetical protein
MIDSDTVLLIQRISTDCASLKGALESALDQENKAYEALTPEQQINEAGDELEDRISSMEDAVDYLDDVIDDLGEAEEHLNDVVDEKRFHSLII